MVVSRVAATEDRPAGIEIYSSEDLVDWTYESTYGSGGEAWECPSLYELPVERSDETRWVMTVSPVEGRTVEHHIGYFDGTEFVSTKVVMADYGYDFYATQTWSNTPENRGLHISWMNNWNYAMNVPTDGWRGAMTVPRTITLVDAGSTIEVRQSPAAEITETREETVAELDSKMITPGRDPLEETDVEGRTLELCMTIDPQSADEVGLRVREEEEQESVIAYDAIDEELRFERSNAGEFFDPGHKDVTTIPLEPLVDGTITLRVLIDRSSVRDACRVRDCGFMGSDSRPTAWIRCCNHRGSSCSTCDYCC